MELQLHTTFPAQLAQGWNALLAQSINDVPFLRYEYLEAWWQTRGGGEWPEDAQLAIVTAHVDGALVGIAPFFHARYHDEDLLLPIGAIEISDYLDFIVRADDLTPFLSSVIPFLQSQLRPGEKLELWNVLDSSPTLPALEAYATQSGLTCTVEKLQHSPFIPLPGDWETYLAAIDKKQRHEIRRKMRRAENAEVATRWYFVTDSATVEDEMDAFMALMEQDPDKARFLTDLMRKAMRTTARLAFDNGYLSLAFYEIDGKKAAAYFSMDYLNRIWVYNSGIDRDFNELSPGWVLLGELLRWANENKKAAFDFMRGDEDYKYRFGGVDRFVMKARIG